MTDRTEPSGEDVLRRRDFLLRTALWGLGLPGIPLLAARGSAAASNTPVASAAPAPGAPPAHAPGDRPAPFAMRSAYSAISGSNWPAYVAADRNLFAKYGLDVHMAYVNTSVTMMPAILSHDLPLAWADSTAVVNADAGGGDAVLVAGFITRFVFYLYSVPSVRTPDGLKGKKVAISKFGSATDSAARLALQHYGVAPAEVGFIQAGGVPNILASLKTGVVQAGVLSPPINLRADALGFRRLIDITALDIPFLQSCVATTRTFLRSHRPVALSYLKTLIDAVHQIKTDKAMAKSVLAKVSKVTNPKALDESYRIFAPLFPEAPLVPEAAVASGVALSATGRGTRPQLYYDNSLVRELQKDGFIRSVFGS